MLTFQKYAAAGNDFIIFDDRDDKIELSRQQIVKLCDRRFGIGADGVLLLGMDPHSDFRMHYYNADGSRGEMCGNGARSLIRFAALKDQASSQGTFQADDGIHHYKILDDDIDVEIVVNDSLHPWDLPQQGCGYINTGVPHLVVPVEDLQNFDLDPLGHSMNGHSAHPQGTNVNLVEQDDDFLNVRTWERGVDRETLACGTGATAVAIYGHEKMGLNWPISLSFRGGFLQVDHRGNEYWLMGPAKLVFHGQISTSTLMSI